MKTEPSSILRAWLLGLVGIVVLASTSFAVESALISKDDLRGLGTVLLTLGALAYWAVVAVVCAVALAPGHRRVAPREFSAGLVTAAGVVGAAIWLVLFLRALP